ncbi:hypothetical protein [Streptomyces hokutonensis]|uniref:hypothetical protein n=1 Tax=Streptomyces hokutonensis TaxID=1306990 RepID=UPI000373A091|nr:hypothetical protein [Streptomyces hokutonensis]
MSNVNRPVIASAALHAERIRAAEQQRAEAPRATRTGQSTAERYAERALAGHRADEELRTRARMNELRARGVIGADPEPDDEEEYDDTDEVEEYEEEGEQPVSTAERYARRERERQEAGRHAALAARRGATQAVRPVIF